MPWWVSGKDMVERKRQVVFEVNGYLWDRNAMVVTGVHVTSDALRKQFNWTSWALGEGYFTSEFKCHRYF